MRPDLSSRVAVDVGGTFSDLICFDESSGKITVAKGPSSRTSPDESVVSLLGSALAPAEIRSSTFFLHGTTIGLNALLERRGARVGLLTTRGFRDTLELRRGDRDAMYDLRWRAPEPVVPRQLRLPVRERIAADGTMLMPVSPSDVADAAARLAAAGVEAVAVSFLNSYANPVNELAAEAALREAGFTGPVILSHATSGEFREYERTSTAVVDAYIRPLVAGYLARLRVGLAKAGFRGRVLITRSGGGALTAEEAARRPVEIIMSGPVAGAMAAADLSRRMGRASALAIDIGGTSFDASLIQDGAPRLKYEGQVAGLPLQTDWVDVRSIGAGGGSIAFVDGAGALRVGPRSAGATPGPSCYGRGGEEPTVTDAAALLGMLGRGRLAGGLELDLDLAGRSLERVAGPLGLPAEAAAAGVIEVTVAQMTTAIRTITVEQGLDPREAAFILFGGAGPLFGCLLAREFDLLEFVVPPLAGNFSAWGLLSQDIVRSAATTLVRRLGPKALTEAVSAAQSLADRLRAEWADPGADALSIATSADLRYSGQEYTLNVPIHGLDGQPADWDLLRQVFTEKYGRTFGHTMDAAIELVNVRVQASVRLPELRFATAGDGARRAESELAAYSFELGRRTRFRLLDRGSLGGATSFEGPAIISEATATTYVDAGFSVAVDELGSLRVAVS